MNEIIVVKQLPVIVEQLAQVKETVIQRVQTATSLVCTDETVKEVKKARAELNAEFKFFSFIFFSKLFKKSIVF